MKIIELLVLRDKNKRSEVRQTKIWIEKML